MENAPAHDQRATHEYSPTKARAETNWTRERDTGDRKFSQLKPDVAERKGKCPRGCAVSRSYRNVHALFISSSVSRFVDLCEGTPGSMASCTLSSYTTAFGGSLFGGDTIEGAALSPLWNHADHAMGPVVAAVRIVFFLRCASA
ncbi:hypothetical protein MRX96_013032 [Rhipicephalus microplus]